MDRNPYRPPGSELRTPGSKPRDEQWWLWLLLSLEGRLNRKPYWAFTLLTILIYVSPLYLVVPDTEHVYRIEVAIVVLLLWPSIAVQVKRWHDINWSGWWVAVSFIPLIGPLFALAMNGVVRGTDGPNRFGKNPLEQACPERPVDR